ncbi:Cell division trigger factor [Candidatus Phaeomarinobacter ectocarpi]|uniref:Trigger factor n=1 Tax=Candidatus Phaeomarinibacter ectocarpi TaxID=1458461 RepID=X5MEH6_9HYPH|nr:trigger factor [Candidatus Phaeomarinobacter ectocarpi]CDO60962.1 Cell division trigger factor [Candidatus Phaeomarinobacter ectocarpi]
MQVTETLSEGLKREFTVVIEAADLAGRLDAKLDEIKGQVQLKGFRPGKVPKSHLMKTYGKSVMGDVIQETVGETSQKAIEERELKPALQPNIELEGDVEPVVEGKSDLTYKLTFEIMPDFDLPDFSALTLTRPVVEVSDEEVDESITQMAAQQQNFEPKDEKAKAEDGDRLTIDFLGKVDDVAFEGGTAEGASLVIGSGQFIPGFEEQLVGSKAGDDVTVNVTFPAEYGAEHLAGKDAVFEVKVQEVAGPAETKIDDEFATQMGLESLDALKEALKGRIGEDYGRISRNRVKRSLLDELDGLLDFELPPTMLEQEIEQIIQQAQSEKAHSAEDYDPEQDHDHDHSDIEISDEEKEEFKAIAERRVRLGLLLSEVGTRNEVQVTQDEVNRAIAEQARNFPGQEQQVFQFYTQNQQAQAQIRAPLFEDKVVDYILELAKVTDETVTREALLEDPDAPAEDAVDAKEEKPKKKAAAKKKASTKKKATSKKKDDKKSKDDK